MKIEKIKPIPKYIEKMIRKRDRSYYPEQDNRLRYYAYLTKNDGELVKVTVAVKNRYKKWYCKQVAVHGIHSKQCFLRDMVFYYISGYRVGWHDMGFYSERRWYEDGLWGHHDDRYFDPWAPLVNKEYLSKFPEYKYAAWELYDGVNILQYLRLYEKFPQMEYLMKMGLRHYAFSKQILRKAGKDKRFRRWLSTNRTELQSNFYYVSTVLTAYRTGDSLAEMQAFEETKKAFCRESGYQPIRDMLNGDYKAYFVYVDKQQISHRLYLDYLRACNYLGLDMSEDKNRYPHDFMRWHDIRIDEYKTAKALKDQEERAELYAKFASVADKYLPLQHSKRSGFVAILARSPADLIAEGNALDHCVGSMGYDQKFIREESLIFFIRAKDTPDTPLVTVEYSLAKKKVLQCYAYHNTKPADEVLYYVNKVWLPYANRALKQIAA